MAHDVFISYSNNDKPAADAVCAKIEQRGVRCWMAPRDVLPGEDWPAAIASAIDGSKVMVLVYTKSFNESKHTLREVERAVGHGLHIIPLRIEAEPLSRSLEYLISMPHWLDAMSPPVEAHLGRLAEVVEQVIRIDPPSRASREGVAAPGAPARRTRKNRMLVAAAVLLMAVAGAVWRWGDLYPASSTTPAPAAVASKVEVPNKQPPEPSATESPQEAPAIVTREVREEVAVAPITQAADPVPVSVLPATPGPAAAPPPAPSALVTPAVDAAFAEMIDGWKGRTLAVLVTWKDGGELHGVRSDWTNIERRGDRLGFDVVSKQLTPRSVVAHVEGSSLTNLVLGDVSEAYELPAGASTLALVFRRAETPTHTEWDGLDKEVDMLEASSGRFSVLIAAPRGRMIWVGRMLLDSTDGQGAVPAGVWFPMRGGFRAFDVIANRYVRVPVGLITAKEDWELRGQFAVIDGDFQGAVESDLRIIVQVDPSADRAADPMQDPSPAKKERLDPKTGMARVRVAIPKGTREIILSSRDYGLMWNNLRLVPMDGGNQPPP